MGTKETLELTYGQQTKGSLENKLFYWLLGNCCKIQQSSKLTRIQLAILIKGTKLDKKRNYKKYPSMLFDSTYVFT